MTGQAVKDIIQQGFDTAASGFDHPSLRHFPDMARRMVEHLVLQPHEQLLDICTGTGQSS